MTDLPAGRDLDALIHERVMYPGEPGRAVLLPYSTDIAAAWPLIEKAFADDVPATVGVSWHLSGKAAGYFCHWGGFTAYADTAPLAICRAALQAVRARADSEPTP